MMAIKNKNTALLKILNESFPKTSQIMPNVKIIVKNQNIENM